MDVYIESEDIKLMRNIIGYTIQCWSYPRVKSNKNTYSIKKRNAGQLN